jgi:hypothetical protein
MLTTFIYISLFSFFIYGSFYDAFSISNYTELNDRMDDWWVMKGKGYERKQSRPNPGHILTFA